MKIFNKIMCVLGWVTFIAGVGLGITYGAIRLWALIVVSSALITPIIIGILIVAVICLTVALIVKSKKKDTPYSPFYNK